MGDVVGRLFREFAVTLSVTILVSAVVSLTLTPMMCAKLLRPKGEIREGAFHRVSERGFEWVIRKYGETLKVVLRHQPTTLAVTVGTLLLTLGLYAIVGVQDLYCHTSRARIAQPAPESATRGAERPRSSAVIFVPHRVRPGG
jgi:multidrug efflux pump subunit AcrB